MNTILIVEDDKTQGAEMAQFLESCGYATCLAEDGEKAIATIVDEAPDLVMLDLNLPCFSGHRVIDITRKLNFRGAVIAMSADPLGLDQAARDWNFSAVIPKPVDSETLRALVAGMLDPSGQDV